MREFTEKDIRESESTKRIIAERDRYKAALEAIADDDYCYICECSETARKALEGTE